MHEMRQDGVPVPQHLLPLAEQPPSMFRHPAMGPHPLREFKYPTSAPVNSSNGSFAATVANGKAKQGSVSSVVEPVPVPIAAAAADARSTKKSVETTKILQGSEMLKNAMLASGSAKPEQRR